MTCLLEFTLTRVAVVWTKRSSLKADRRASTLLGVSPVTHLLTGWVVASAAGLNRRERAVVTVAAVIPDVDGLGVVAEALTSNSAHPLLWFSKYHHALHTLLFALIVAIAAYFVCRRNWKPALLAFGMFHVHLVQDLVGSRGPDGYDWPISYLSPLTQQWSWSWSGQWDLNSWQNIAVTVALCSVAVLLAVRRGYSPVDLFSPAADRHVVDALHRRFSSARRNA